MARLVKKKVRVRGKHKTYMRTVNVRNEQPMTGMQYLKKHGLAVFSRSALVGAATGGVGTTAAIGAFHATRKATGHFGTAAGVSFLAGNYAAAKTGQILNPVLLRNKRFAQAARDATNGYNQAMIAHAASFLVGHFAGALAGKYAVQETYNALYHAYHNRQRNNTTG